MKLIDGLDDHDRVIDAKINLGVNQPSDQAIDLLQPGILVAFAADVEAQGLYLGQDRRIYLKNGQKYEEYRHRSYAIIRISREFKAGIEFDINQKMATLLSELELGRGAKGTKALEFLSNTLGVYRKHQKLQRYLELKGMQAPSADEKSLKDALRSELSADEGRCREASP